MEQKHLAWKSAAEFVFITTLLKLLGMSIENTEKQYIPKKQEIFNFIKCHYSSAIHNPYILFKQKYYLLQHV